MTPSRWHTIDSNWIHHRCASPSQLHNWAHAVRARIVLLAYLQCNCCFHNYANDADDKANDDAKMVTIIYATWTGCWRHMPLHSANAPTVVPSCAIQRHFGKTTWAFSLLLRMVAAAHINSKFKLNSQLLSCRPNGCLQYWIYILQYIAVIVFRLQPLWLISKVCRIPLKAVCLSYWTCVNLIIRSFNNAGLFIVCTRKPEAVDAIGDSVQ